MKKKIIVKKQKKRITTISLNRNFPYVLVGVLILSLLTGLVVLLNLNTFFWKFSDTLAFTIVLSFRTNVLTMIMKYASWWGMYGTLLGWILLYLWFIYKKNWILLSMMIVLSIGGYIFGESIKYIIGRDRPIDISLIIESGKSFPSLHTYNSTIFYLTLVYLLYRYTRYFWITVSIFICSICLIFIIGSSRIYLGVHYLSDVLAGFCFGLAYVCLVLLCYRVYDLKPLRIKK